MLVKAGEILAPGAFLVVLDSENDAKSRFYFMFSYLFRIVIISQYWLHLPQQMSQWFDADCSCYKLVVNLPD